MKIEFEGHSDDLIHVNGAEMLNGPDAGRETAEISACADGPVMRQFEIVGSSGVCTSCGKAGDPATLVRVVALYLDPGVWTFAVAFVEEDKPIPGHWKVMTTSGHSYSAILVIDTGADEVKVRDVSAS